MASRDLAYEEGEIIEFVEKVKKTKVTGSDYRVYAEPLPKRTHKENGRENGSFKLSEETELPSKRSSEKNNSYKPIDFLESENIGANKEDNSYSHRDKHRPIFPEKIKFEIPRPATDKILQKKERSRSRENFKATKAESKKESKDHRNADLEKVRKSPKKEKHKDKKKRSLDRPVVSEKVERKSKDEIPEKKRRKERSPSYEKHKSSRPDNGTKKRDSDFAKPREKSGRKDIDLDNRSYGKKERDERPKDHPKVRRMDERRDDVRHRGGWKNRSRERRSHNDEMERGRYASDKTRDKRNFKEQNEKRRHKDKKRSHHRPDKNNSDSEVEGTTNAGELLSLMLEDEEEREQRLIEERRKKREEILQKHARVTDGTAVDEGGNSSSSESSSSSSDDESDADNPENIIMVEKESTTSEAVLNGTIDASEKPSETFDIFSNSPTQVGPGLRKHATRDALMEEEGNHLAGNWDDGEGYYKARVGELIADRYLCLGEQGKGVFSTVLKAQCNQTQQMVAIKMIRNNDTMRKAAIKEVSLLEELTRNDPDNRKHCVRLLHHTEFRQHTCLVFESMSMNLRETLKKFGRKVGINVNGVRIYARQMFTALRHLASLNIVHADIKPDNILVSANHSVIKLCDFGSAFKENDPENDPTPYLVSRFYRAPEIILGLTYDRNIDTWSVCSCLYELFTGYVMFQGKNNNEMLKVMQEYKGPFNKKLLKRHIVSYEELLLQPHFEEDTFRFRQQETDPVTGRPLMKIVDFTAPTIDLKQNFLSAKSGTDDKRAVLELVDLLEKGLALDPAQRLNVKEAIQHPFLKHQHKKK